jgi:hypothetical protein
MQNIFRNQATSPFRQPGDVRVRYTIVIDCVSAMGDDWHSLLVKRYCNHHLKRGRA